MPRGRPGRGGPRTPANPAPVSGPGALSQRTDGGPAQPIRSAPMAQHGERGQIEDAQRAAPLPQGGGGGPVDGPLGPANMVGPGAQMQGDVFGPLAGGEGEGVRPNSPIVPASPDEELAILFELHPSPGILRILQMRRRD